MKVICNKCHSDVNPDDIDMQRSEYYCFNCDEVFPVTADVIHEDSREEVFEAAKESFHSRNDFKAIEAEMPEDFDINDPPSGAWHQEEINSTNVGATTRGASAIFFGLFITFWGGGSISGIYISQIIEGKFDLEKSVMGLPFLIGTIVLSSIFLMKVFGKTELKFSSEKCTVFTGLGSIGWTRSFYAKDIEKIERTRCGKTNGKPSYQLSLSGNDKTLNFGMMVSDERQEYLQNAIKVLLDKYRD